MVATRYGLEKGIQSPFIVTKNTKLQWLLWLQYIIHHHILVTYHFLSKVKIVDNVYYDLRQVNGFLQVLDLRQVNGFLQVLQFPLLIKVMAMI
jgi:hypothetical protein